MIKQRIEYDSPLDALIAITKQLGEYENRYSMKSEEFFDRYGKGMSEDSEDFICWANDYRHYMAIRYEIERQLRNVA
ncbi:MAG: hypothetical protein GY749_11575 [Desulfobacteraceae bacterium]|nr:hypothetical protein [Desulfobacteraceae bacterium]